LGQWLVDHTRESEIVTAASPTEIAERVRSAKKVDLVVLSIGAGRIADPEVMAMLQGLGQSLAEVPIIVISDNDDVEEIAKAVLHGVRGYVSTRQQLSDLAAAIQCVEAGGTFVPAETLVRFVQRQRAMPALGADADRTPWEGLTPREMEVVARLREGKPNKVIAHDLQIGESTVKAFVRRILIKLHALNRTEVAHLTEGQFESIQAALRARGPHPPHEPGTSPAAPETRDPAVRKQED
jgi:DNA-binding NarL/FixJ family response regulator